MDMLRITPDAIGLFIVILLVACGAGYLLSLKGKSWQTRVLVAYLCLLLCLLMSSFLQRTGPAAWQSWILPLRLVLLMFTQTALLLFSYTFLAVAKKQKTPLIVLLALLLSALVSMFFLANVKGAPMSFAESHFKWLIMIFLIGLCVWPPLIFFTRSVKASVITSQQSNSQSVQVEHTASVLQKHSFWYWFIHPASRDALGLRAFGLLTLLPMVLVAHRVLVVQGLSSMAWHDVLIVALGSLYVFGFVVIFLNHTQERSSVHAKLVGLSLITVLMVLQVVSSMLYSSEKFIKQAGFGSLDGQAIVFAPSGTGEYQVRPGQSKSLWRSNSNQIAQLTKPGWVTLGFEFPFYDQMRQSIYITNEGFVTFNAQPKPGPRTSIRSAQAFPNSHLGTPKIMPLYSDWVSDSQSEVDYFRNNDKLIVTWHHLLQTRSGKRNTFQLQLNRNGNIAFVYQHIDMFLDSGVIGLTPGGDQPRVISLELFEQGTQTIGGDVAVISNLWERHRNYVHPQLGPLLVVIVIITGLILLGFPWFYRRVLTRPMNRLLDGLQAVDQGALKTEIGGSANDEFGLLAAHFNRMTISLRQSDKKLKHYATELELGVQQRTLELANQNTLLERQWQQLQELDAAKSRFFANLSHEFRTPLTLTIGPLADFQAGLYGQQTPEAVEQLEMAIRNSRKLLRLINQILDIAKIDADQFVLNKQSMDVVQFLHDIAQTFIPLAERKRMDFQFDLPEKTIWLDADPNQLEQIITNLLSNAFKFTVEAGSIRLALEMPDSSKESGRDLLITVRDNGCGISANQLGQVFERFYQADEAAALSQPGTGIGLSLTKELVELHNGQITVQSEPGFGSTFTVRLPASSQLGSESQGRPGIADEILVDKASVPNRTAKLEQAQYQVAELMAESSNTQLPDPEDDDQQDQTIVLVVDDNPEVRSYIRKHLAADYRVIEAEDGEVALEMAARLLPDLVVSDVMMPKMDGSALCRALRHNPKLNYVPVILLTAKASEADILHGLELGADDYLAKPFSMPELLARIQNLIESRHRLQAHYSQPVELVPEHIDVDSADKKFLHRLQKTIEKHLDDPEFNVERLAGAIGQSRGNLHRRVRATLNQTPTDVIRDIRLQRGADLLAQRAGSVSEVAYSVGFKGVAHFSTSFRNKYGVPPSSYAGEY